MSTMLKQYFWTASLISTIAACASDLASSPQLVDARATALAFIHAQPGGATKTIASEQVEIDEQVNEPALYVFNFADGGFAVVPRDAQRPVAFSLDGSFDVDRIMRGDGPEGVAQVIDRTKALLRSGPIADTDSPIRSAVDCSTGWVVKQLPFAPLWNQDCGWNSHAPLAGDGPCYHAYAGCVAVAVGQVMEYFHFPASYNWSAMSDTSPTDEAARLLRDIGDRVGMSYSGTGSSAHLDDADDALRSFGYAGSTQNTDFSFDKVKTEITAGRPLLMAGHNTDIIYNGHAWVVDGYYDNEVCPSPYGQYLHNNWGWSGSYNGWYASYAMSPGGDDLNHGQELVVGIHPATTTPPGTCPSGKRCCETNDDGTCAVCVASGSQCP